MCLKDVSIMVSFDKNVWEKYQNVVLPKALGDLQLLSATNKNLNIVITDDNFHEIDDIISYCIENSLSLDIMFRTKYFVRTGKTL